MKKKEEGKEAGTGKEGEGEGEGKGGGGDKGETQKIQCQGWGNIQKYI